MGRRKRKQRGRCVHCGQWVKGITDDHLIPLAWYPDTTPGNLEKWKFPSCVACNDKYGWIERRLLILLGMCLSVNAKSAGVPEKAIRALSPSKGRNKKDKRARQHAMKTMLRRIKPLSELSGRPIPGFGPADVPFTQTAMGFTATREELDDLKKMGEKFTRGIAFKLFGVHYMEAAGCSISVTIDIPDAVASILEEHSSELYRGPGVRIRHAVVEDEPPIGCYETTVWGRFRVAAIVTSRASGEPG